MKFSSLTHQFFHHPGQTSSSRSQILTGILVMLMAMILNPVFAAEKFVGGGGNALFTNAANWENGNLPDPGDNIEIKANCVFDQPGAIAYGDLTIKDGAVLSFLNGSEVLSIEKLKGSTGTLDMTNGGILRISKAWEANPGNLTLIPGSGTIHCVNSGDEDFAQGYSDFHALIIECGSKKVKLKNDVTFSGNLTIVSGTLMTNDWTIHLDGDWVNQGGSFDEGNGQVVFTGCGQSVSSHIVPDQFHDVSIANCNCVSFNSDVEITGTFTSGSGGLCSHILSANQTNFTGVAWQTSGNTLDDQVDFIGSINDADVKVRTNNAERMVITSDGEVGIGTMNPTTRLDVDGGARIRNVAQDDALEQILVQDADGNLKYKEQHVITDPLNAAIDAEQTRALVAEAALQADIDQNKADSDAADAALEGALDAEVTRATTAEETNAAAIAAEEVRALAAEAALQADMDQSEVDRNAADAALQADINQNKADSDAADAALQTALMRK
ncbi:MAG: hypothetical protein IPJ06_12400 [Saprospiraceae bacterium]|nr:hypothetical protein [Saprospiraceae bacterium]